MLNIYRLIRLSLVSAVVFFPNYGTVAAQDFTPPDISTYNNYEVKKFAMQLYKNKNGNRIAIAKELISHRFICYQSSTVDASNSPSIYCNLNSCTSKMGRKWSSVGISIITDTIQEWVIGGAVSYNGQCNYVATANKNWENQNRKRKRIH